jgi:hypothetical protein
MKIKYKELERRKKVIDWFSNVKMAKLLENSHKGNWENEHIDDLIEHIVIEVDELKDALLVGNHTEIIRECADISNFAMFVADKIND